MRIIVGLLGGALVVLMLFEIFLAFLLPRRVKRDPLLARRVAIWYATVTRATVMAAHGGVARALMANFHILPEEEATHADILHGVVYVFDGGTLARYS